MALLKKCPCLSGCQGPKEYTPKGAAKGKRTKKSGQSPYFVGYEKHTLRLWLKIKGKNRLIPLVSFIEPANVYEGKLLGPMIQKAQEDLSLHIDAVVGDMGYICRSSCVQPLPSPRKLLPRDLYPLCH
jgi:hypothetical protein